MEDKLRQDFPIDWEEDHFVSRREFLKFMTLASGGLAAGTTALAAWSRRGSRDKIVFEPAAICRLSDIKYGESLGFSYPRKADLCILVRKSNGDLAAYTRRCTHLSCPVNYEPDKERLYCPCHNGAFSVEDGRVLQGPPPHPLPAVDLEIRGEEVWAIGVSRSEVA